jgi:hypothetical protein
VQNDFGLLATLLRLGLRLRYEVIEKYSKLLGALPRGRASEEQVQQIRAQLRGAVETIECDAMSRGAENIDRPSLLELFDTEQNKIAIADISDPWDRARAQLLAADLAATLDGSRRSSPRCVPSAASS